MGELIPLRSWPGPACPGPAAAQQAGPQRGWCRERRLWWLLWAACPGLGWVSLRALEAHAGSLEAAWSLPLGDLPPLPGRRQAVLEQLDRFRRRWGQAPLERWAEQVQHGRRVLLPGDGASPPQLGQLERPPVALHWRGRGCLWPSLARRQAVAVVGTRRPSRHGLAMAEALGRALAAAGWPVVSGLAEGIDAACHRGCLAAGGRPVAVLGTPLERVYPRHHGALQHQVGVQGLLISEHARGAPVRAGQFASRNRLQVALARAVVVVECPDRSGALHSARLAWRQQLPLWVVPADAARVSARGSNRLLGDSASVLLDPQELVSQLGCGPLARAGPERVQRADPPTAPAAGDGELLRALGERASLEHLCLQLQQPAGRLAPRLLALELAGLVRAEPGLHWRRL
ncbi:MAG: DNA-processing protein DprA [Cyanobacteria bacterium J06638_7]